MRFIRVITSFILILSMLAAVGCTDGVKNDGTLSIVCTIFPQYDFARSIAGDVDGVEIKMLMGAGQDSHSYDPSSKDMIAIHDCDIFIYVGGESDSWIDDVLESVDTKDKKIISLVDVVGASDEETHEHKKRESDAVIEHVDYDEHVWTSPKNAMIILDAICSAMCEMMPEAEEEFHGNHDAYSDRIGLLDDEIRNLVSVVENEREPIIVVADRFPLYYFCEEYGIKYYAAFTGCAASTEPSSKTLITLIEKVKDENIPVVFKMDLSQGDVAETVAEATGAEVLTFYSCHTLGTKDFEAGETYLSMMTRNYEALSKSFGLDTEQ